MDLQPGDPVEDIKRLQRCINDLVSLLALPAMWSGAEPSQIVHTLLDALVRMLDLDFVYVRLKDPGGPAPLEMVRFAPSRKQPAEPPKKQMAYPHDIGKVLKRWSGASPHEWPPSIPNPAGEGDISIVPLGLGLHGEIGVIVAGSERADFPRQAETLILSVAANQAAIGLQEARRLSEQKRVASELDRRVAQRTAELAATNQALIEEIAERKVIEERVRESEVFLKKSGAKLRQVIDTIPTLSWCNRTDGTNEFLNKRWHEYTGLSPEEADGWGWQTAFHPEDLQPLMERWQKLLISGEPGEIEARLRRYDGVYRWFLISVSPFRDEAGTIVRWYGTSTDIEDRKVAEEALRSRAHDFSLIIDTIPALAWSAWPDGRLDFCNQRWLNYTGLSLAQAQDWGWAQATHPDDLARLISYWQSVIATGESGEIEARLRRFDGEYRWFLFRAEPLRDESGAIAKWYGTNTDIDDRKHAHEDLRSSEEKHRLVVETANDAIVSMDDNGTIQFANPATARIFGYDPTELVGRPLTVLMPQSMRELHNRGFRRYLATGHRHINWQGTELTALGKNGREFPVEISFGELTRDGHKAFIGFIRDISERKRAEDKVRASERDLSLIIETIPGLVWCAAPDGELNYLNQRILDYTGTDSDAWAQLGWKNLLHPDDAEPTAQAWSRAVATGQPLEVQCRLRRSDGAYRWFQALGQGARDSEGGVARWYGVLIDIDDRKNAEQALRDSQTRLSLATRTATVGEFAAAIAHEINQPLAAVVTSGQACLRWLAAQPPGIAKAHEAADRIVRDGKEAAEIVRRIRALFKQATAEKIELDLNDVIGEVLHLLAGEAERKRVAVETDLGPELAPVVGDRVQLQQLIFNLLLNGIEAMDAVVDRPKKLSITSRQPTRETVLCEVRDYGTGLKDPDRIFEAFFTTKEKGMGMGLAICRSIIDAHHGRVWAASREGHGTTFSFTLPVQVVAAQ